MPLFFITTGVLLGLKGNGGAFHFQRKAESLLFPYFIWATLYQMFLSLLAIIGGASLKEVLLYRIFLVLQFEGSAMWFLPTMFLSSLLFSVTIKGGRAINIICATFAIIVGIFSPNMNGLLGCVLRALIGFGYITIGFYLKGLFTDRKNLFLLFIAAGIHLLIAFYNPTVDLAYHYFGNPCLYILESCLGTFVIYQISIRTPKEIVHSLVCIGKYSIVFLCLHGFVIQAIRILDYKLLNVLYRMKWVEGIF